ncbi:cell envelope integrity EipB family protein [Methylobrevis albus]|uniref:Cell envelope integrity EipB family protein n=1 Tax=Methylobrevis albus TaxID=2793297 RepID=A0A931N086_9HYPH|nr:cell envelope integrity EipB family protein [Methylobrevis albus]MBH0239800.1 cell envelope integrity EipB family protein [Methylobrevis albus]
MTKTSRALLSTVSIGLIAAAGAASATELLPHRAIYDLALADATERSNIAGLSGRMVLEFTGAACEGYTTNFRFVLEFTDNDEQEVVTDLRTSTYEAPGGESFQFLSQTYTNQVLSQEVKGSATRGGDGVVVKLEQPEGKTVDLGAGTMFPTGNLVDIIATAEKGGRVLEADIFDGSDTGQEAYRTTAMISAPEMDAPSGPAAAFAGLKRWPVNVAYFDIGATGDQVPEYSIAFDLYENGVSDDLTLDYGDFQIGGRLATLEPLPVPKCD